MKISKIGFYGIRNTGPGLVQTVASEGLTAVVYEKNDDIYHNALTVIENNVDYEIEHWGMTRKDKKILMSRIEHIDAFSDFMKQDIDIIVESVEENIDIKKHAVNKIENELELNIPVILTAQINMLSSVTEGCNIEDRAVNIHPVPSVPTYKLVEMIKGKNASEPVLDIIERFFDKLDLKICDIPDCPGGMGPRILISTVIESCNAISDYGIDKIMADNILKKGLRMYKGPLKMADELGLDTIKAWIEEMNRIEGDRYAVPKLLEELMEKGYNGLVNKNGFLTY